MGKVSGSCSTHRPRARAELIGRIEKKIRPALAGRKRGKSASAARGGRTDLLDAWWQAELRKKRLGVEEGRPTHDAIGIELEHDQRPRLVGPRFGAGFGRMILSERRESTGFGR